MANGKVLARVCALAFGALSLAGCQQRSANEDGDDKPSAVASFQINSAAAIETPAGFPQWAFPGPLVKSIPGSKAKYSDVQMFDRTSSVDWYPETHPAMPDIVKGRLPVYACGFCHLPQGAGRSENAALAGLPAKYIVQQLLDFKSGARKTADRKFGAAVNMELTAAQLSDADAQAAAAYYAGLKYTKHVKLVEAAEVPDFASNAFVYVFKPDGPRQPLGQRIIEGPDNFELFEMRDPNMTFTAYVPVGSIARGAALAKGDGGARPACESCHGPGLKGAEIGPPIAGRLPTGLFRQLYGFQSGARNGVNAAQMKPIVAGMSHKDMIDLAAYLASLEP